MRSLKINQSLPIFSLKILNKSLLILVSILIVKVSDKFAADYFFLSRLMAVLTVVFSLGGRQLILKYTINLTQLFKPFILLLIVSIIFSVILPQYIYFIFATAFNIILITISSIYIGNNHLILGSLMESMLSSIFLVAVLLSNHGIDIQLLFFLTKLGAMTLVVTIGLLFPVNSSKEVINRLVQRRIYAQGLLQSVSKNLDAFIIRLVLNYEFQTFYYIALQFSTVLNLFQETNNTVLTKALKARNIPHIQQSVKRLFLFACASAVVLFVFHDLLLSIMWKLSPPDYFELILLVVLMAHLFNIALGPIELFMNINGLDKPGVGIKIFSLILVSMSGLLVYSSIWPMSYLILVALPIICDNLMRRLFLARRGIQSTGLI